MRILFVEDDPDVLQENCELLQRVFPAAEILTATHGRGAREKLEWANRTDGPFDVAILDLGIPEAEGDPSQLDLQLCEDARRLFPDIVVIHYTAYASDQRVQRHAARLVGYDTIVEKTDPARLLETIRQGYGDKLAGRTRDVLGHRMTGPAAGPWAMRAVPGGQASCGTGEVNALLGEIRESFAALDEQNQREIQRYVVVEKTPSGLLVSVGGSAKEGSEPE